MREPNRSRRRTRRASDHARREGGSCGKGQQWRFIVPPDFKTLGEREGSPSTPEPAWKGRSVCPCRAARGLTHNKCRTDRESRYKCPQHPRSGFHKGGTGLLGCARLDGDSKPPPAGNDMPASNGEGEPAGPPVAAARRLPPAQRRLPPHRSHRATLEDGAGWSVLGAAAVPGTSPSLGAPSSISSTSP